MIWRLTRTTENSAENHGPVGGMQSQAKAAQAARQVLSLPESAGCSGRSVQDRVCTRGGAANDGPARPLVQAGGGSARMVTLLRIWRFMRKPDAIWHCSQQNAQKDWSYYRNRTTSWYLIDLQHEIEEVEGEHTKLPLELGIIFLFSRPKDMVVHILWIGLET
jgi:hypothetical protein